ncbi:magnesium transport protein CorA [Sinomonas cyclohexanicum]|uniref:Magnesium transport protein CorA n=1 Tax=Sinomonas cyclohexanicum TaxID=322009 RepID=A0ABM7PY48_SINCY|nr:magnesium/cobalt transporter CorA [Corynebacterium cyclohexanicum]BCT76972.1 magnesium transport protein CorA [Corynebacterium cyclohexanicum]
MIIDNAVYLDGHRAAHPETLEQTFETLDAVGGSMAWIGLYRPTIEEMAEVAQEFHLHDLAVEDAINAHQRPKMERYDQMLFTVLRPARYVDETETVEFGELHIFTGPNYVVTVRHAETAGVGLVRKRLETNPDLLRLGPEAVLYALLDRVVDDYRPVVAGLENDIDEIEDQLFANDPSVSRRIYELTREVLQFQRAVHPLKRLIEGLESGFTKHGTDIELQRSLRDVHDHLEHIVSRADEFRDVLQNALVLDGTLTSNRQNETSLAQNEQVKRISSWAAIFFAPALVTGIYGMNFKAMPELEWDLGYPYALVLMVVAGFVLWLIFKWKQWL